MELILELSDKELRDITHLANKMPRGSAILYNNEGQGDHHFRGLTVLVNGQSYWITAWFRLIKGEVGLALQFEERKV
jgi:hypothetical protein